MTSGGGERDGDGELRGPEEAAEGGFAVIEREEEDVRGKTAKMNGHKQWARPSPGRASIPRSTIPSRPAAPYSPSARPPSPPCPKQPRKRRKRSQTFQKQSSSSEKGKSSPQIRSTRPLKLDVGSFLLTLCSNSDQRQHPAIALPNQSIVHQKDEDTPTTKRKLTYDDLISHLKHYSPGTRRGEHLVHI